MTRDDRIARKADRMYDAIRRAEQLHIQIPLWIVAAANAYDESMSDTVAEATDTAATCVRCDTLLRTSQRNGFIGDNLDDAIAWAVRQMGEAHRLRRERGDA
jgi:hypothetical protein